MNAYPLYFRGRPWVLAALLALTNITAGEALVVEAGFEEKATAFRKALQEKPMAPEPLEELWRLYAAVGREQELLTLYEQLASQPPQDFANRVVQARLRLRALEWDVGVLAKELTEDFPEKGEAWAVLAENLGERDEPGQVEAWAKALFATHDPSFTNKWLKRYVNTGLGVEGPMKRRAVVESVAERYGEAVDWLAISRVLLLAYDPGLAEHVLGFIKKPSAADEMEIVWQRSRIKEAEGKFDEAFVMLDGLRRQLGPGHERWDEVLDQTIVLAELAGRSAAWKKEILAEAEAKPEDLCAVSSAVEILEQNKEFLAAARIASRGALVAPPGNKLASQAYYLWIDLNASEESLTFFAKLSQRENTPDLWHVFYFTELARLGRVEAALEVAGKVLAATPEGERERLVEEIISWQRRDLTPVFAEGLIEISGLPEEGKARLIRSLVGELSYEDNDNNRVAMVRLAKVPEKGGAAMTEREKERWMGLLLGEHLYEEALSWLRAWAEVEPLDFAMELNLIMAENGSGRKVEALQRLVALRKVADSPARFKQWLDAGTSLNDTRDDVLALWRKEVDTIFAAKDKSDNLRECCFALAEKMWIFSKKEERELYEKIVGANGFPKSWEREAKHWLAAQWKLTRRDADDRHKALEAAQWLVEHDEGDGVAARLELVGLLDESGDSILAEEILREMPLHRVKDSRHLVTAASLWRSLGEPERQGAFLLELTKREPWVLEHWQRWLDFLVKEGRMREWRQTLGRLMEVEDEVNLTEANRKAIRKIRATLAWLDDFKATKEEVVYSRDLSSILDAMENKNDPNYEARKLLTGQVAKMTEKHGHLIAHQAPAGWIRWPFSGWWASDFFQETLEGQGAVDEPPKRPGHWEFRWTIPLKGFHAAAAVPDDGSVLLLEEGFLRKVDGKTGATLWTLPQVTHWKQEEITFRGFNLSDAQQVIVLEAPKVWDGCFYRWNENEVEARRLEDGSILWRSPFAATVREWSPAMARMTGLPLVFVEEDRVLAVESVSGRIKAWQKDNGKLLWEREGLAQDGPQGLTITRGSRLLMPRNTGVCHEAGRLFVFSDLPYLLDTKSNRVLWVHDEEEEVEARIFWNIKKKSKQYIDDNPWKPSGFANTLDVQSLWQKGGDAAFWSDIMYDDWAGPLAPWWRKGYDRPITAQFQQGKLVLRTLEHEESETCVSFRDPFFTSLEVKPSEIQEFVNFLNYFSSELREDGLPPVGGLVWWPQWPCLRFGLPERLQISGDMLLGIGFEGRSLMAFQRLPMEDKSRGINR